MADIFDYLKKRGSISFAEDPFNEVDNLVLAMLAYADFDGIMDNSFKEIDLETADRSYFEKHSYSKWKFFSQTLKSGIFSHKSALRNTIISNGYSLLG